MATVIEDLRQRRLVKWEEARSLAESAAREGRYFTPDEQSAWDGFQVELDALDERISGLLKGEQLRDTSRAAYERVAQGAVPEGERWVDATTGREVRALRPEHRLADVMRAEMSYEPLSIGKYLRGILTGHWKGAEAEARAMSEGSLGGGGYLVPSPLAAQVIDRVRNASVVNQAGAVTIPMEAQTLKMARVTQDPSPAWHSEAAVITGSDMQFDLVTFTAQTLAALCQLSVEVVEDAMNIDDLVVATLGKVLALELDRAALRGSGTAPEPRGIRNASGVAVDSTTFTANGSAISTTAPSGSPGWDWLAKAYWGRRAVNETPNAAVYAARTAQELDLLRASTGEQLPPPGAVAGLNQLITNSIPINLTQGTNSDCSEAYVGDFTQLMIGTRTELTIEVSREANVGTTSLFSTLQVGIRAYLRADVQLARPAAFSVLTGIR